LGQLLPSKVSITEGQRQRCLTKALLPWHWLNEEVCGLAACITG